MEAPKKTNEGGCGLFAYFLAYEAKKEGIHATIHAITPYCDHYKAVTDNKRNPGKRLFGSANHFVVNIKGVFYDSYGEFDFRKPDYTVITLEQMRVIIAKGRWNNQYPRKENK